METAKLKKMLRGIEDTMTAASFAEEGEAETARSILKDGRKVLLGLKDGRIDPRTLKYALNTAKRIGAQLDILYVASGSSHEVLDRPLLERFESELRQEDIAFRQITRTGCLKQQIIDYSNTEKEILFAVIESPNSLDVDCNKKDRTLSELWRQLKCPLVVVMDGARA
jgi:hypothetical protein